MNTCEKYGIDYEDYWEIPPQWEPHIEKLIQDLIELGWDKNLHQVKVKFGGLRFYTGKTTKEITDRIARAEYESYGWD